MPSKRRNLRKNYDPYGDEVDPEEPQEEDIYEIIDGVGYRGLDKASCALIEKAY